MLDINKHLTQSLRTINIILFVRLQNGLNFNIQTSFASLRDQKIWPDLKVKVPCALLPFSVQRGKQKKKDKKKHGKVWQERVQTGSVRVFGGSWPGPGAVQVSGLCACPAGGSSRSPLSVIFSVLYVSSETKSSPASRRAAGPRRPPPAWPGFGTCWSGTPSPAQSAPCYRSQCSEARWPCDCPATRCCWAHRSGASWLETGHQKIRSMGWPRKDAQDPSE